MFNFFSINSTSNKNPPPVTTIYPYRAPGDGTYEVSEEKLRSALHIPKEFKWGRDGKTPVILVPGTGSFGGEAFNHNFAKLLKNSSFADPVWINVPGQMNDASFRNAEHVAYAISYISTACNKKVAVAAWSQGNLATQWTLKYWPSTRQVVNNFIALSADFHGTFQASVLMPLEIGLGNPGVWSQRRHSNFIRTLRADGGDSAYVPTTSIFSSFDEVVSPQIGELASAWIKDENGVAAKNYELQRIAPFTPAGMIYSHETVLSNPISWALAEDAIKNGGPGQVERLDLYKLYARIIPEGLNLIDGAATAALMLSAGGSIALYPWKVLMEPSLPAYATATAVSKVDAGKQPVVVTTSEVPAEVI